MKQMVVVPISPRNSKNERNEMQKKVASEERKRIIIISRMFDENSVTMFCSEGDFEENVVGRIIKNGLEMDVRDIVSW